jgi:hypothetical protein
MSEQEMNNKMEFIVEHQAKFAAEIQVMREVQAADAKRFSKAMIGLVDIVGTLTGVQTEAQARTDESLSRLSEAQARLSEAEARLSEAQARTEASLNILINVVDRHISGNGGPHNHAQ